MCPARGFVKWNFSRTGLSDSGDYSSAAACMRAEAMDLASDLVMFKRKGMCSTEGGG